MRTNKNLLSAVAVLSILGAVVSGYALWQHYAPVGSAICNFGEYFSCDIVNKSPWSELFGIPVAGLGLVGYLLIASIAWFARRPGTLRRPLGWLVALSVLALAFCLYLSYIEFFVIGVACPACLLSQIIILLVTACALVAWRRR